MHTAVGECPVKTGTLSNSVTRLYMSLTCHICVQEVYAELVKLSEGDDFMKIMSTEVKGTPSPSQKNGR